MTKSGYGWEVEGGVVGLILPRIEALLPLKWKWRQEIGRMEQRK